MTKETTSPTTVPATPGAADPVPADYFDPVIEAYKKDVDRTLLRENLKLTVEQRIAKAISFHKSIDKAREAGRRARLASMTGGRS
jgi:hypothetical protein